MSLLAIGQSVRSRLLLNSPTPNIAWDAYGAPRFAPPPLDPDAPEDSLWVRPSHGYTSQGGIYGGGGIVDLADGEMTIQCFGPFGLQNGADELVEQTAEQVAEIFDHQRFDGIHFRAASFSYVTEPEGNWHQINVTIPFMAQIRSTGFDMDEQNGRMNFSQAGHGFTGTTAVRVDSGSWVVADRASQQKAQAIVLAIQGDSFQVATHGIQGFSHGLGTTGNVWLGDAGALLTSEPGSGLVQRLGTLKNSDLMLVQIEPGEVVV